MTVEIISWSISTKVWDRAGIELATPGSAVKLVSVARYVTECATRPCRGCEFKTHARLYTFFRYFSPILLSEGLYGGNILQFAINGLSFFNDYNLFKMNQNKIKIYIYFLKIAWDID